MEERDIPAPVFQLRVPILAVVPALVTTLALAATLWLVTS